VNKKAAAVNPQMIVYLQYATAIKVLLVFIQHNGDKSEYIVINYAKKIANCSNIATGK